MANKPDLLMEKSITETPKKRSFFYHLYTLYLFTRNDFKVILYPQTAVGIFQALSGSLMTTNSEPDLIFILSRLPLVAFWNWLNLLTFNLANQRLPNSVLEDSLNKSWRPIPARRISADEARLLLLFLIPVGIVTTYVIGGFNETVAMLVLTWMYNDLGGGDVHYFIRNLINAGGFMAHASGSTAVAAGFGQHELSNTAPIWIGIIGAVVLTTLQVQDIPDMEGDAARGRKTLPLVWGDLIARISVAVGVLSWSLICPMFWSLNIGGFLLLGIPGALVVYCTLAYRSVSADERTYKLWCIWLIIIYLLPLYKNPEVFTRWSDDMFSIMFKPNIF